MYQVHRTAQGITGLADAETWGKAFKLERRNTLVDDQDPVNR